MKKKLLKTFLLAAGLLVGGNAWADTSILYNRATTTDEGAIQWSALDWNTSAEGYVAANAWIKSGSGAATMSVNNDGNGLLISTDNKGTKYAYAYTYTFTPTANAILTYDFVWSPGSTINNNDNWVYIQFGNNIQIKASAQAQSGKVILGDVEGTVSNACNRNNENRYNDLWTIHMVVNTATNTVTALTISGANGKTKASYTLAEPITLPSSSTYTTIAMGYSHGGGGTAASSNTALKSMKIQQETQTVANYTVHFKDGSNNTLKGDEVRTAAIGSTVNANSIDKTAFVDGDNKYTYSSDGGGTTVVVGGTAEFTVTYEKHAKFTYKTTATAGGSTLITLAEGYSYAGEPVTRYWSKYINLNGQWYVTNAPYGATYSEATDNTVTYTASDITYFVEGENMNGYNAVGTKSGTGYSGGLTGRSDGSATWYTEGMETAGCYVLSFPYERIANSSPSTLKLSIRDSEGKESNIIENASLTASSGTYTKENILIPAGSSIQIAGTGSNSNYGVDYITLKKSNNVSKTISSAGWATFCSPCALDFSGDIDNLTNVYIITGSKTPGTETGYVATTSVKGGTVAAGTGLLIKGEGTITIPVATSGTDYSGTNKLVGVTANTKIAANAGYVLMNDATYGLGFYKNVNEFTVGANTAYLPSNFAGVAGARSFFGLFDDVTGINGVESANKEQNQVYNLNGQRVAQPSKGLYIINGKKVVMK